MVPTPNKADGKRYANKMIRSWFFGADKPNNDKKLLFWSG